MTKENAKTSNATVSMPSSEELHTVSGGTQKEEDYAVTTDEICPYCGSTQVYKASMQKNFGFTKIWREYTCRKCGNSFWHEENC